MSIFRRILVGLALLAALACAAGRGPLDPAAPPPDPVPEPAPAAVQAYVVGLTAIDPRIIGSHSREAMIGRGMDTCRDLRDRGRSRNDLTNRVNHRFTAPEAPDGFGVPTAQAILGTVQRTLCPQYPMPA